MHPPHVSKCQHAQRALCDTFSLMVSQNSAGAVNDSQPMLVSRRESHRSTDPGLHRGLAKGLRRDLIVRDRSDRGYTLGRLLCANGGCAADTTSFGQQGKQTFGSSTSRGHQGKGCLAEDDEAKTLELRPV